MASSRMASPCEEASAEITNYSQILKCFESHSHSQITKFPTDPRKIPLTNPMPIIFAVDSCGSFSRKRPEGMRQGRALAMRHSFVCPSSQIGKRGQKRTGKDEEAPRQCREKFPSVCVFRLVALPIRPALSPSPTVSAHVTTFRP